MTNKYLQVGCLDGYKHALYNRREQPISTWLSASQGGCVFKVTADNLQSYFNFDPDRTSDLRKLDGLLKKAAPTLKRYFHQGTPVGEPGMRFKMIGYGKFNYLARSGQQVEWPVVGVALQKSYISVYLSITKNGVPLVQSYAGRLGELRMGNNNFSFVKFEDLELPAVSSLFAEAEKLFGSVPGDRIQINGRTIRGRSSEN